MVLQFADKATDRYQARLYACRNEVFSTTPSGAEVEMDSQRGDQLAQQKICQSNLGC